MLRTGGKGLLTIVAAATVLLIGGCGRQSGEEAASPRPPGRTIKEALGPGRLWRRAETHVVWPPRNGHASLTFNNSLWVIGGQGAQNFSDVWRAEDGLNWTRVTEDGGWPARVGHAAAVFKGRIWLFGGNHGKELGERPENDVWASRDGVEWTRVLENAPWSDRLNHAAAVLGEHVYILGGETKNPEGKTSWLSDVWRSADGENWVQITDRAPWKGRNNHGAIVFRNQIWVLGGWGDGNLNDVWRSSNGKDWEQTTAQAPWPPRNSHAVAVYDDMLWVAGGWGNGGYGPEGKAEEGNLNDVWRSSDGVAWEAATEKAAWLPRNGHTLEVFERRLWVIGGWSYVIEGNNVNDIWLAE